jgi:prepilin-type N-terminal cleavage/methylation domain-containing protein
MAGIGYRGNGGRGLAGGGRGLSTIHLKPAPQRRSGFTLIELLGVMAIIGILAAVVLPPMISKIEEANTVSEDTAQATIADAILKGIRANARFPNPNVSPTDANFGWITLAQNFYPGGVNALRYVFPEAQNFAQTERRVYLDPALLTYLGASFGMPATGFASTDTDGDGIPNVEETALRMYIVSSSKSDLVLSCPANGATAQPAASNYNNALINDLLGWVKAYQDPTSANAGAVLVPTSIANWASAGVGNSRRGEYLHVKIVPLENLFCRVRLIDCASPGLISSINNTAGNPYERNSWYTVNDGYGTALEIQSNNGRQMPSSSPWRVKNDSDGYNDRSNYTPGSRPIESTPGVPNASDSTANFVLPSVPRYQLNAAGINLFTTTTQTLDFYVLMGTRLRLYNGTGALLRDENIASDCTKKYWNSTWSKSE